MKHLFILSALALAGAGWATSGHAQSDWIKELEAGCAKNNAQDCSNLGGQLKLAVKMGEGKPEDLVRARAAFEKGCRLGHPAACAEHYIMLSIGEGGPKDPVRARQIEPKACNTGIISLEVHLEQHGLCVKK